MSDIPYTYTETEVSANGETVGFTLPLNINKIIKKSPLSNNDVFESSITESETNYARFYNSQLANPLINTYAYRISQSISNPSNDILTVSPIQLNNSDSFNLTSYSFGLPSNIITNCIVLSESDNTLTIDLLLDINIMVTLRLNFNCFYDSKYLNSSNFYSWCSYTMPYSFGQRKPILFKVFDSLNILCSTNDGGLLLLKRSNANDEFNIIPFTNSSYLNNIKSKFFFSKSDSNNEIIEFGGLPHSSNSIIDILPITDDIFLTISINKKLTFWSISQKSILKEIEVNQYLSESLHSAVLSPIYPNSLLKLSYNYLSILLSLDNCYIQLFNLDLVNLELKLVNQLIPPNYNKFWFPIDYEMLSKDNQCELWISWIFSDSVFYQNCKIIGNTDDWSSVIEANKFGDLKNIEFLYSIKELNAESSVDKFAIKFIKSKYNENVICNALKIFNMNNTKNYESSMIELIQKNSSSLEDYQNEWIKFASVCQDISNKKYNKIFSINLINSYDPFFITIKDDNKYSIILNSCVMELLYFNNVNNTKSILPTIDGDDIDMNDVSKLAELIIDYSKGYSESIVFKISEMILTNSDNLMNEIFEKFIINIANADVVNELLTRLSTLNNASNLIQYLSTALISSDFKLNQTYKLTQVGKDLIIKNIISNLLISKKLIFGMMLILLTLDNSKPIEKLFFTFRDIFKYIKFIELVGYDAIDKFITSIFNDQMYIKNSTFNNTINRINNELLTNKFVYFVISDLIKNNESESANDFIDYLPESNESILLRSLIFLETGKVEESKDLFIKNTDKIIDINASNLYIESYTDLIVVEKKIDYFMNLSSIFESKNHYIGSLELILEASKQITEFGAVKDNEIFLKIFELSIKLKKYELSYSSIKQLKQKNKVIAIKKFIYELIKNNQINKIIDFNYGKDLEIIDEIILELSVESINLNTSIKYFRLLYSLRLKNGNFRGAIESLYLYNTIAQTNNQQLTESIKKIINDNYLIILNLLKSMDTEDSWIIKNSQNNGNKIVTIHELEEEFELFKNRSRDVEVGLICA